MRSAFTWACAAVVAVTAQSVLLEPIAVTKDNVKSTVIADGFVTASELCTGAYAAACKEAGISG